MSEIGKHFQKKERAEELAHGGLVSRDGDMVTLGDGSRWWLNGEAWARASADATITHDTMLLVHIAPPMTERSKALKELAKKFVPRTDIL